MLAHHLSPSNDNSIRYPSITILQRKVQILSPPTADPAMRVILLLCEAPMMWYQHREKSTDKTTGM